MRCALVAVGISLALLTVIATPAWATTTNYSKGNLDPALTTSWNSNRDGISGSTPANFTAGDVFVVQTNNTMTTTVAWTVSGTGNTIQIENGGTLMAAFLVTTTTFLVDDGGTYIHNNTSGSNGLTTDVPGTTTRYFAPSSTVEYRKWGTSGGSSPVVIPTGPYGNLTLNMTNACGGSMNMVGTLTTIIGNFTVQNTWSGGTIREFRLSTSASYTLIILGNLNISGGILNLASSTGAPTVNIGGQLIQSGGWFRQTGSIAPVINITGNSGKITITTGGTNSLAGDFASGPVATNAITLDGGTYGADIDFTLNTNRGITLTANGGKLFTSSTRTLTIPGNITGPGALTKVYTTNATTVNVTLSGVNDFAGDFTITGGGVRFNSSTAAGAGTVRVSMPVGGSASTTLRNTGVATSTLTNNVEFNANNGLLISLDSDAANTFVMSGKFSGVGAVIHGVNSGGTVVLSGDNSAWSGGLTQRRGLTALGHKNALGTGTLIVTPTSSAAAQAVTLYATNSALTGANAVTNAITIAIPGSGTNWTIGGSTDLELSGSITLSGFSPAITNNNTGATILSGPISGAGFGLTFQGTGRLSLSGNSTYNGGTTVGSGTVLVNNTAGSGTGSGAVTVLSGATLGGTGTISGLLTVNLGATLAPGASIGRLTLGAAPVLAGTTSMEINRGASPNADKLVLSSGTLTYGGALTVVNIGAALQLNDTFDLFDASAFAGSFSPITLPSLPTGLAWDTTQLTVDGTIRVVCNGTLAAGAAANTAICLGGNYALNGSGTGGSGAVSSYAWTSTPAGFTAGSANPTVSPTVTTTYHLTVADTVGCTATVDVTVTVNSIPTSTITAAPDACANSTNNTASVPTQPGVSYLWTISNGSITAGAGTDSITYTAGGSGSMGLDCAVTNTTTLCGSSSSASVPTVVCCTAPAIVGGIDASSTNVCVGNPVILTLTNVTGTAALFYQWQTNSVDILNATNSSYTNLLVTLADAASYNCVVTNACGSVTSSVPVVLTVNPLPVITTTSLPNGTYNSAYSQTVVITGATGVTATGLPGGLSIDNSGLISGLPTASGPFLVAVTATNAAGCSASTNLSLTVDKATPTATLAVNNSPVTYDANPHAATVTVSSSSVPGGVANILTGGAADQTAAGTYAVTADFVPTDTANYNTLTAQPAGNFVIDKATPTATLAVNNSPVTYDANPHAATVTISSSSVPGSVANILTGGAAAQTLAGSYPVTANFVPNDTANYNTLTAQSAGNFVIDKATALVALGNLSQTYDGSAKPVTTNTTPAGLNVLLTYSNATYSASSDAPTNAATYTVYAVISDANYQGGTNDTLVINKATPTATLAVNNSPVTYDANPHAATVTISSSSVPGSVANILTGGAADQTAAGTYGVTADFVPTDTANYNTLTAQSAGNFVINKAAPTAVFAVNNSPVAYDGNSHAATATISSSSVPGSVANILTGGAADQTAAGTYGVTADFVPTDTANYNTLTAQSAGNFVIVSLQPVTIISIANTSVTYSGGSGLQFVLLSSGILDVPMGSWTRVQTNSVTPGTFTIPVVGSSSQLFYRIQSE